jgi:hypothetical protein
VCHGTNKNDRVSLVALMTSCIARADERLRVFSHSLPYRGKRYCLPTCTRLGQDPTVTKFRSSCRSPPRGLSRSIHPHYLSGHASTNHFEGVARITASRILIDSLQPSILGLWLRATHAGVTPACQQNISSPHVQRFVMRLYERASHVPAFMIQMLRHAAHSCPCSGSSFRYTLLTKPDRTQQKKITIPTTKD